MNDCFTSLSVCTGQIVWFVELDSSAYQPLAQTYMRCSFGWGRGDKTNREDRATKDKEQPLPIPGCLTGKQLKGNGRLEGSRRQMHCDLPGCGRGPVSDAGKMEDRKEQADVQVRRVRTPLFFDFQAESKTPVTTCTSRAGRTAQREHTQAKQSPPFLRLVLAGLPTFSPTKAPPRTKAT